VVLFRETIGDTRRPVARVERVERVDWASSLTLHDALGGSVAEQIGDIVGPEGFP